MDRWRSEGKAPAVVKFPNGELRRRRDRLDEWLEGLAA
jgi:hypothetical protein